MKKYSLIGTTIGGIALAVTVPFAAQFAGAQSASSASSVGAVTSQACVQAMASVTDAKLASFDAHTAAQKTALVARNAALKAAAALTDDAARQTATQKAHEEFRAAAEAMRESNVAAMKTAHDAVQAACGNSRGFGLMMGKGGQRGMMGNGSLCAQGNGSHPEMLATKLGITVDQLNAEMAAGKTIQEIAEDRGVDLPALGKKQKGRGGHFGGLKGPFRGQSSAK